MVDGGVYVVLKICLDNFLQGTVYFNAQDIAELTGLSIISCRNNLNKLAKRGFIIKEQYRKEGCGSLHSRYKISINGDFLEHIRNIIN